jgi:hypothetical protein
MPLVGVGDDELDAAEAPAAQLAHASWRVW